MTSINVGVNGESLCVEVFDDQLSMTSDWMLVTCPVEDAEIMVMTGEDGVEFGSISYQQDIDIDVSIRISASDAVLLHEEFPEILFINSGSNFKNILSLMKRGGAA